MRVVNFMASIRGFVDYSGGRILREIKWIVLHGPQVQLTSLTEVLMVGQGVRWSAEGFGGGMECVSITLTTCGSQRAEQVMPLVR